MFEYITQKTANATALFIYLFLFFSLSQSLEFRLFDFEEHVLNALSMLKSAKHLLKKKNEC